MISNKSGSLSLSGSGRAEVVDGFFPATGEPRMGQYDHSGKLVEARHLVTGGTPCQVRFAG